MRLSLTAFAVAGALILFGADAARAQTVSSPGATSPAPSAQNAGLGELAIGAASNASNPAATAVGAGSNVTGNYPVLRELVAPGFQANSAEHLAEIFAKQRNEHLDLAGVAAIEPQLTLLPQIEANGLMHMAGFFPSVPQQVSFELAYAPVNEFCVGPNT